jgi:hypothetical protein
MGLGDTEDEEDADAYGDPTEMTASSGDSKYSPSAVVPAKKMTRSKQVLSVTPDLFKQMRASQRMSPGAISNMFMDRQKSCKLHIIMGGIVLCAQVIFVCYCVFVVRVQGSFRLNNPPSPSGGGKETLLLGT